MVLVKNWYFFHSLFLGKIVREILFADILDRKEGFFNLKIYFQKSGKIRIFAKGLVHGFGQKLEFFP